MKTQCTLIAGLVLGTAFLAGCPERPEARPAPDRAPAPTAPTDTVTPPRTDPAYPGTGAGVGTQDDAQQRAQTLIDRAQNQIDNGQFVAAEQTLQELEQMRGQLPQHMQQEIDLLRTQLQQAQGGIQPGQGPGATEPQ